MRKNGFTLIELLAVIVVLAIILAIAVPSISSVMNKSSKSAFESDAKLVLKAAQYKVLENSSFNPTDVNKDNIKDLLGLSNQNYSNISIIRKDNAYQIIIVGSAKWNGLIACGTFENMKVVENASDCNGNMIPPVITILGDNPINIYVGETYTDAGATAIDDIDGDITSSIHITSNLNPSIQGSYNLTYSVEDTSGNIATATRIINVVDNVGPTITFGINGNSTYAKNYNTTVTVTDTGGINTSSLKYLWSTSAVPPSEDSFSDTFTSGGTIISPTNVTGSYYLWILAKDLSSNTTISNSNIFNLDNTPPVITISGSNSINIYVGDIYTDAGATATDNIDGDITSNIQVTSNLNPSIPGTYTITYNVVDSVGNAASPVTREVKVIGLDPRYNAAKGVNSPTLISGMTPIKWNGTAWVDTTESDTDWYNYDTTNKQWANARTADGSMWVWIPRFIYKIPTANWHTATAGTIAIQFSKGANDNWNSSVIGDIDTGTTSAASNNKWTNHPAFTFGNTEVIGIWVAKFEASGTTTSVNFVPNVASLRTQTIGTFFTAARNMETNTMYGWGTSGDGIDTHMMKNSEWGAVTYLAQSLYGKNSEVWTNSSSSFITGCAGNSVTATTTGCLNAYNTATGANASTTGTIYGIYDMSAGAWEYMASYIDNGNAVLNTNGSVIIAADSKYKDVYTKAATDSGANNYALGINKKGDAVYETSSTGAGTTSWYSDNSLMPSTTVPFFLRSGSYNMGASVGIFSFYNIEGAANSNRSFRSTLLVETGL